MNKFKPVKRNGKYLVRIDLIGDNFYEYHLMGMDHRMANEAANHCNFAITQAISSLLPILELARERILSIDNGDCFDAVLALEKTIQEIKNY